MSQICKLTPDRMRLQVAALLGLLLRAARGFESFHELPAFQGSRSLLHAGGGVSARKPEAATVSDGVQGVFNGKWRARTRPLCCVNLLDSHPYSL